MCGRHWIWFLLRRKDLRKNCNYTLFPCVNTCVTSLSCIPKITGSTCQKAPKPEVNRAKELRRSRSGITYGFPSSVVLRAPLSWMVGNLISNVLRVLFPMPAGRMWMNWFAVLIKLVAKLGLWLQVQGWPCLISTQMVRRNNSFLAWNSCWCIYGPKNLETQYQGGNY